MVPRRAELGPARGNPAGPWDQSAAAVSEAVRFAHAQGVTAAGRDAETLVVLPGEGRTPGRAS